MSEHKFLARLFFQTPKAALCAFESVKVEVGEKFEKRSTTLVNINKNVVQLEISSLDKKPLQASANSYLKLFLLCEKISEVN